MIHVIKCAGVKDEDIAEKSFITIQYLNNYIIANIATVQDIKTYQTFKLPFRPSKVDY